MTKCNNNFAFLSHSSIFTAILNIHCFFFTLVYIKCVSCDKFFNKHKVSRVSKLNFPIHFQFQAMIDDKSEPLNYYAAYEEVRHCFILITNLYTCT